MCWVPSGQCCQDRYDVRSVLSGPARKGYWGQGQVRRKCDHDRVDDPCVCFCCGGACDSAHAFQEPLPATRAAETAKQAFACIPIGAYCYSHGIEWAVETSKLDSCKRQTL